MQKAAKLRNQHFQSGGNPTAAYLKAAPPFAYLAGNKSRIKHLYMFIFMPSKSLPYV